MVAGSIPKQTQTLSMAIYDAVQADAVAGRIAALKRVDAELRRIPARSWTPDALPEPPSRRVMDRAAHPGSLVDRGLLTRAFGVLGPTEALVSMTAFLVVLAAGGWTWGATPASSLLASASGAAFAAIALGQMANAFACRSTSLPVWRQRVTGNRLVLYAVGAEVLLLVAFLALPPLPRLLGGTWPTASGWALAALAVPAVLLADAAHKNLSRRFRTRARGSRRAPGRSPEEPSPRRAAAAARG